MEALIRFLLDIYLSLVNLIGLSTGGASEIVSLTEEESAVSYLPQKLMKAHFFFHLEAHCAKYVNYQEVIKFVVETDNYISFTG